MSEPQERAEEDLLDTKKASPSKGPWDPFRYLIKTISPQQRVELLQLQVPILPPEEFMTTRELRTARMARWRKWWPAMLGGLVLLIATVAAAVHFLRSPTSAQSVLPSPAVANEPPRSSALGASAQSTVELPSPPIAHTSPPIALTEPPSEGPHPALGASAPLSSSAPSKPASAVEHQAAVKVKPSAPPAPSGQVPHRPDGPDFEQPFNPQ